MSRSQHYQNAATQQAAVRIEGHLALLYPDADRSTLTDQLITIFGLDHSAHPHQPHTNLWDQHEIITVTYGNSIERDDQTPLKTLHQFLNKRLRNCISTVHILPFFPSSSDDGFSVIDYSEVNPELGDWESVSAIAGEYRLMADLVINHCSASSRWFENYRLGRSPGVGYFYQAEPTDDLLAVVRPRTSPLLRAVETTDGLHHVWCTFSHDQIDLDFSNPAVLLEFARIIRLYLDRGITIFRLDAVAFLWKEPGTSCINLPQTHEMVRLLRTLIEHHSPNAIIITETNIPNHQNITYFGNANEAHLIYNFSLPPLLLNTLLTGECDHLLRWMMSMPPARNGTAYLNFIASHDGIGLRPVEGLLSEQEVTQLISAMEQFGGSISWRTLPGGEQKAYEINIALFDAMQGTIANGADQWGIPRFLCAHAIMLALEGIPAIYIHSFLATKNDYQRQRQNNQLRAINRHQWNEEQLNEQLDSPQSHHAKVFTGLQRLIKIRREQPAFHPNATQFTLHLSSAIFGFWRQSIDREQSIFALNNVSDSTQTVPLADINLIGSEQWYDLISGETYDDLRQSLELAPYQVVWITNRRM